MPKSEIVMDTADVIKSMNIYEKMLHIQSEIPTVAKNLNVDTGKNKSYKAVSERDVKDALKPLEEKYGVYSFPVQKELIEQTFLEQETQYGKRKSFYIREKVTYRFVNVHNPSEYIEIDGYGDGIDTGDKSTGKADTYASKYCLMSAYKISTGDDPDRDASETYTQKSSQYDPAALAVELTKVTGDLRNIGIDIHDEKVAEYICKEANVKSIDGGQLLTDLPGMARVISVMKVIAQKKAK